MAETAATVMSYGPEVAGFEPTRKGLDNTSQAKQTVNTMRNQGRSFQNGSIPPAQIYPNMMIRMFII